MTFIYTPPEPSFYTAEFHVLPECATECEWIRCIEEVPFDDDDKGRNYQKLYTEAQLSSEVERVRRETIKTCAKVCRDKSPAEYATGKVDHNEMAWVDSCAIDILELLK